MQDKHNQNEEYMTLLEIIGSIILFAMVIFTVFIIMSF